MLSFNVLITICLAYVILLFAVAFWADKRAESGGCQADVSDERALKAEPNPSTCTGELRTCCKPVFGVVAAVAD